MNEPVAGSVSSEGGSMDELFDRCGELDRQRNARVRGYAMVVVMLFGGVMAVFLTGLASLQA